MFNARLHLKPMSAEDAQAELAAASELLRRADRILTSVSMRAPSEVASSLARIPGTADFLPAAFGLADLAKALQSEGAEA